MTTAKVVSSVIGLLAPVVELIVSIIGPLALIAKTMSRVTGMAVQVTGLQCGKFKYNAKFKKLKQFGFLVNKHRH